nr:radical SAM protein [bacterium]
MKVPNARKPLSYLALARAAALSNVRRPKLPYKLTFSLTSRCNLRCRFCRTWRSVREDELSPEEIREFFRRQPGFNWIDFTGGEISLRPDLEEILADTCRLPRLALLHFPTNGFLVERIVDVCVFAKARAPGRFIVSVSLDGPPELHDRLRGREGSWENAVATYAALRRRGVEVFF